MSARSYVAVFGLASPPPCCPEEGIRTFAGRERQQGEVRLLNRIDVTHTPTF
jgi:hypothetical protein